ncbi:hypothetical protein [Hymenobacter convexus]|uniref:hypothetical protein n=1 Tax=Hymenobacter sp. CA1UV-4 TaxID=3063782 RepID=UPI002714421A|nr:hypothetical protein [Hymenobacter sp. CA1UV-4]MDO7853654.1 hypothetical protein [Hymenobacter sp. CA1UV-4]
MKTWHLFPLLLLAQLALAPDAARAQAPATTASPSAPAGTLVVVYFREKDYRLFEANFDTDGQSIGGLDEKQLNKEFSRTNSTAKVLNFVAQNGYRLVSFTPLDGETYDGRGDGFGGYTALFERLK